MQYSLLIHNCSDIRYGYRRERPDTESVSNILSNDARL